MASMDTALAPQYGSQRILNQGFAQGCGAQLGGRLLREAVATIGGLSVAYSYVCLEHDHR
jgi:hypothetical protein